jgi:lipopolysaccharide export system ATP-binding protein
MMTKQKSKLAVHNIGKSYGKKQVLFDISLNVKQGEVVGLLGPNGAGKTTLFYIIVGLIRADNGKIDLDDKNLTMLPMYQRARMGVGYLPQEASIFRDMNVEDNILAVLEIKYPKDKKRQQERLSELLKEFSIEHIRTSPATALSGGERRRVEIARALASDPDFILLDEPFAGIDPIAVGDIRNLVQQLTARNIGVLITDHNVRETLEIVDRAYIIYEGKVLTHGTPKEIVAHKEVRDVYLGKDFKFAD